MTEDIIYNHKGYITCYQPVSYVFHAGGYMTDQYRHGLRANITPYHCFSLVCMEVVRTSWMYLESTRTSSKVLISQPGLRIQFEMTPQVEFDLSNVFGMHVA